MAEDGLLVPCGQARVLAEYLQRLLQDADLRERLGRAGQQKLGQRFDWEHTVFPLYQELYTRLTTERR